MTELPLVPAPQRIDEYQYGNAETGQCVKPQIHQGARPHVFHDNDQNEGDQSHHESLGRGPTCSTCLTR